MTTRTAENKRSENGAEPGFEKGTSGNPARRFGQPEGNPSDRGGRPKSLAANIREKVGDDGDALISELLKIAKGRARTAVKVAAIRELLDRGFGKPSTPVELSGPGGGPIVHKQEEPAPDWDRLTDQEMELLTVLTAKVRGMEMPNGPMPTFVVERDEWIVPPSSTNGQRARALTIRLEWPVPPASQPLTENAAVLALMGTPPQQRL